VKTDFYNDLRAYLKDLEYNPRNITGLEDICKFNEEHAEQEGGLPHVHPAWPKGQDNLLKCRDSKGREDETYRAALAYIRKKSRDEGIDAALTSVGGSPLDGLLVPLQADRMGANQVAAKAGYPVITVPVGVDGNGVPFGICIMQTAGQESSLIKYASAIEDLHRFRLKPGFLNLEADNYPLIGCSALEKEDEEWEKDKREK